MCFLFILLFAWGRLCLQHTTTPQLRKDIPLSTMPSAAEDFYFYPRLTFCITSVMLQPCGFLLDDCSLLSKRCIALRLQHFSEFLDYGKKEKLLAGVQCCSIMIRYLLSFMTWWLGDTEE